ncbi:S8 family serine peptidase [Lentzea sp. NPDC051838]|uniref:S8 family peptidase n=1 Tax=Lentzea sp. NPDC051838 TaxID=3154849 RepID=UPI0034363CB3
MTNAENLQIRLLSRAEAERLSASWTSDSSYGITALPESVLARHGARILDPMASVQVSDFKPVASTVYRTNELLIRADDHALKDAALKSMLPVLQEGLGLVIDEHQDNPDAPLVSRGVLRPDPHPTADRPTSLPDAWRALQTWRSTALQTANGQVTAALHQVSLNYLMIGAAMGGIGGASDILRGVPGAIGGNPGPDDELGYWRRPVAIKLPQPERAVPPAGRRPVIAVLDTGLAENKWLSVARNDDGLFRPLGDNAFLAADQDLQVGMPIPLSAGIQSSYWEGSFTVEPLTGYLSSHTGHATFVIGVIRQTEPRADVLSVRVMYNDGIVYAHVLIDALKRLLDRVVEAQDGGHPERMVDVISLSLGGYREAGAAGAEYDQLTKVVDALRARGVIIVAAAGNYASSRPFFPAALADRDDDGLPRVISVGARNPNGTKAFFSNDGPWVRCWAPGAGIVSTYPENVNGSRRALFEVGDPRSDDPLAIRQSLESDDYRYGYAEWSGTSFAAPMVAARLATRLMELDGEAMQHVGVTPEEFGRTQVGKEATLSRARAAVDRL